LGIRYEIGVNLCKGGKRNFQLTTFRVRRIGLSSAAKFGFVTGAVAAAPVGIIVAFLARVLISWLRRMLEGWQHSAIDAGLLGKIPVDMIRLLNLSNTLTTVQKLDQLPVIMVALVFIAVIVIAGLIAAVGTSLQAVFYNSIAAISSGLEVELESEDGSMLILRRKLREMQRRT
jgi:Flp pilus assembly pilin Flp